VRRLKHLGRRGALGLAAVSLWGCASLPARPGAGVAERAQSALSYSARVKVSLTGSKLRARATVLVAFKRPDALRVELPGPTGARLIAVAQAGRLVAVFPSERAVWTGAAGAAEMGELLGVALAPSQVMDVLLGQKPETARSLRARWGKDVPERLDAGLEDGTRLRLAVETPRLDPALSERAFLEPDHEGYRAVSAEEARQLWSGGQP
jgi:hypothetical protein